MRLNLVLTTLHLVLTTLHLVLTTLYSVLMPLHLVLMTTDAQLMWDRQSHLFSVFRTCREAHDTEPTKVLSTKRKISSNYFMWFSLPYIASARYTMIHSSLEVHREALNVNKTEVIDWNFAGVPKRLHHKNKTKIVAKEKTGQIRLTSNDSSKEKVQTGRYINTEM